MNKPTTERVRSLLYYCPNSLESFKWAPWITEEYKSGLHLSGYLEIEIDGNFHRASHLAYLIMTGNWPTEDMVYLDGNLLNNRWSNLWHGTLSPSVLDKYKRAETLNAA